MATLPALTHLTTADFEHVYEPQEDTWLFCDALAKEMPYLSSLQPSLIAEIGPGTGCVSTYLLKQLLAAQQAESSSRACDKTVTPLSPAVPPTAIVVDVNFRACEAALRTARSNLVVGPGALRASGALPATSSAFSVSLRSLLGDPAVHSDGTAAHAASAALPPATEPPIADRYETVTGDLLLPLLPRLEGSVDVLLFNPPYVPTPDEEIPTPRDVAAVAATAMGPGSCSDSTAPSAASSAAGKASAPRSSAGAHAPADVLPAAWAGGERGRRVIDRVLPLIPRLLSRPHGVAYMILVAENDPREIAGLLQRGYGLAAGLVARRRAANEMLYVMRVRWPQPQTVVSEPAAGAAGAAVASPAPSGPC
jgi:release factor glutamine methyltransferase